MVSGTGAGHGFRYWDFVFAATSGGGALVLCSAGCGSNSFRGFRCLDRLPLVRGLRTPIVVDVGQAVSRGSPVVLIASGSFLRDLDKAERDKFADGRRDGVVVYAPRE
jgi:hypothetical protein